MAVTALWCGLAGAALAEAPAGETLIYDILRNGVPLGTQRFTLRRGNGEVSAELSTEIDYKLLTLTLYTFRQSGREVWRDGKLVELATDTDDNGKTSQLRVHRGDDGALQIHSARQSQAAPGGLAAASLWNRDALAFPELIDTIDGSILSVTVDGGSEDMVMIAGCAESARRYKLTGGLRRELWYHRDGRLLRVRFKASDGSQLEYRLRAASLD